MSSKAHKKSDSEDDSEYVPPTYEQPSSDSDTERQAENQSVASPTLGSEETENRDTLWTNFQTSSSSKLTPADVTEKKMVKVVKKYLFAGEYITEIVEVPEDSPEAKKWPLHTSDAGTANLYQETPTASVVPSTLVSTASPIPSTRSSKKPGPRKPKTVLSPLPSSSTQKAKKLTTLDKSVMDWKAHTVDQALQDELDTNRRGGGYLERVEFLQRVEDRKEENLETFKSRKRRKL